MDNVLNGIIKSNMDIYFNRKKIINDNPNYYYKLMIDKYLRIKKTPKDLLKVNLKRRSQRKYLNKNYDKQITYYDILIEKYDDAILNISEWLDRRNFK